MKAIRVPATEHQTTGKFIDDNNFAFFYHIIAVALHQPFSFQGLCEVMRQFNVFMFIKVLYAKCLLGFSNTMFSRRNGMGLFIDGIVFAFFKLGDNLGQYII
ncbi:hypothetical protein SDC9_148808 [bioreactor metagenome]|uniref:Uncharacterized protein n=1 Tax=bioreactor metagenome TaxID=1076179 RepID=A0A645EHW3_9ZZZZ